MKRRRNALRRLVEKGRRCVTEIREELKRRALKEFVFIRKGQHLLNGIAYKVIQSKVHACKCERSILGLDQLLCEFHNTAN